MDVPMSRRIAQPRNGLSRQRVRPELQWIKVVHLPRRLAVI
jgi:hypothetical protein